MRKKGEKEHPQRRILKGCCTNNEKLITMETFKQFTENAPSLAVLKKKIKSDRS